MIIVIKDKKRTVTFTKYENVQWIAMKFNSFMKRFKPNSPD